MTSGPGASHPHGQSIAGRSPRLRRCPKGRVVEVFGPESSGKTTLTLHAIAQCQAAGGVAAFIDAEHALDIHYAKNLGVNAKELLVSQPDSGEQALDIAEILVRSAAVDMTVVDSVAALVPKPSSTGTWAPRTWVSRPAS